MLAYDIYYMDIINFVYKINKCIKLFDHKILSVHESVCSLQYFVDTMLIRWCFSWTKAKGVTVFHGFVINLLRLQIVA